MANAKECIHCICSYRSKKYCWHWKHALTERKIYTVLVGHNCHKFVYFLMWQYNTLKKLELVFKIIQNKLLSKFYHIFSEVVELKNNVYLFKFYNRLQLNNIWGKERDLRSTECIWFLLFSVFNILKKKIDFISVLCWVFKIIHKI